MATATDLWLMEGLYFKGAKDEDGNPVPEGTLRADPWVVVPLVAQAVAILERLHSSPLLFPASLDPVMMATLTQRGQARTGQLLAKDISDLVAWVNAECARTGRCDAIPEDPHGKLAPSRLRRTLAWLIRRRPRGLVAAAIQYGHLYERITQGYAKARELHQMGEDPQVARSQQGPDGF